MSPTDGIYLYCSKRNQRLSVSVCIFRKCGHLREKDGEFSCKFMNSDEIVMHEIKRLGIEKVESLL